MARLLANLIEANESEQARGIVFGRLLSFHARRMLEVGSSPRSLLGVGGLRSLFRCPPLDIELFGVCRLQPRTFDFVAAREGLDLATFGLLFAEVDRDQGALAADRADGRLGLAHRHKVQRG